MLPCLSSYFSLCKRSVQTPTPAKMRFTADPGSEPLVLFFKNPQLGLRTCTKSIGVGMGRSYGVQR